MSTIQSDGITSCNWFEVGYCEDQNVDALGNSPVQVCLTDAVRCLSKTGCTECINTSLSAGESSCSWLEDGSCQVKDEDFSNDSPV